MCVDYTVFIYLYAGDECSSWPSLVSHNLTNEQFNCKGSITGLILCNRPIGAYQFIHVGLSLWRMGSGVLNTTVRYLNRKNTIELDNINRLDFNSGDQLMFVAINYGSASNDEYKYVYVITLF